MLLCRSFANPPVACLVRGKCRCRFFAVMGYSRKNPHPPDGWGRFLTADLDFLKHTTPLLSGFPRQKTPLPPGFPRKNIRLKFNLFLIENTHNHV